MITISLALASLVGLAGVQAKCTPSGSLYIAGEPYKVVLELDAPEGGTVEAWAITPAGFSIGGEPLEARADAPALSLAPGTTMQVTLDLGPYIDRRQGAGSQPLELRWDAGAYEGGPIPVNNAVAAPKGLDFMTMPAEQLSDYMVLLKTNRGDMLAEFWPDVAPNHVRNFLDLAYTGFYDGTTFHRVIPGFMIQGGDPTGTGTGSGKRMLKAEFNQKKHVAGVLSMARSASPDSASCQFFVMHGTSPHLDGQYSAFGKLVDGLPVVDAIVNTPRDGRDKPSAPQVIQKALVLSKKNG